MRAIRPRWCAALAAAAFFALAAPALAANTTLNFDTSPPATGTVLTTEYAPEGLAFVVQPGDGFLSPTLTDLSALPDPIPAHSGTRAIELDGGEEIPVPKLSAEFQSETRSTVSLWVRGGEGTTSPSEFTLTAQLISGPPITDMVNVTSSAWTGFQVTAPSAEITGFTLTPVSASTQGPFYVDDISYDNPTAGSAPAAFTLSQPQNLEVTQGATGTRTVTITRFNGSGGTITFPATGGGAAQGWNAQVIPDSATASTTTVTIRVQTAQDAPPGTYPVTITPTFDATAAPLGTDHSIHFNLTIDRLCGDPSYGIVHLEPIDGGCFHPNGDGTYSYVGDKLKLNGMVADVTDFSVSDHRLDAALFTVTTGENIPGAPDFPIYTGPIDAEIPTAPADSTAQLVNISTDAIGQLMSPFQGDSDNDHQECGQDGSNSGTDDSSSSSGSSRDSARLMRADSGAPPANGDGCKPGSITDAINLTDKGAEAPLEIKLPSALSGISADVTLKWKTATGFDPDFGYKIKVPSVPFGPLVLGPFELDHTGPGAWTGEVAAKFPQPLNVALDGALGWDQTGLTKLQISVTGLHIPFVAGTFLTSAQVGYQRFEPGSDNPNHYLFGFNGGLGVEWGPQVAGHSLAEIDGTVEMDVGDLNTPNPGPQGGTYWPFAITVGAHVKIAGIDIGHGSILIAQDQYGPTFRLDAEVGLGLPYVAGQDPDDATVSIDGSLTGWVQPPHFDAQASVGLKVLGLRLVGADLLVSDEGMGACVHVFFFSGGFGLHWGHSVDVMGPFGCDISGYAPPYRDQGSTSAANASHTLSYPKGSKPAFLKLIGSQGPPKVTLTGPGSRRITVPTGSVAPVANHNDVVLQSTKEKLTFIAINHPAGKWTLTPEPGSSPIVQTLGAKTMPAPKVSAHVTGTGTHRFLVYHVLARPKQTVQFAEIGERTHRFFGVAHGSSGKIPFTPDQAGPGGTRKIEALVSIDGIPQKQIVVATYKAPKPPKPTDPTSVKVTHTASGNVVVTWKPATLVGGYRVLMTLNDGVTRFEAVGAKTHRAVFPGVPSTLSATATVQVQHLNGGLGTPIGPSKGGKPPKKKGHHKKHGGRS